MRDYVSFEGKVYETRHGGAFDRGSADSYYSRQINPHYFVGATYQSEKIIPVEDSPEYNAYIAGYKWNEQVGNKK